MTVREQVLIPLQGAGEAGASLLAGSMVIARAAGRGLRWCVRLVVKFVASGKTSQDRWENAAIVFFAGAMGFAVAGTVLGFAAHFAAPYAGFIAMVGIPAWTIAAWIVSPQPQQADDDNATDTPVEPSSAFTEWLLQTIGEKPGIHLRDLYPAMRELPGQEHLTDTQLRGALRTLGIPVQRSLRIGRIAGRSGVRQADVQALSSPAGESPALGDGDAGQSADSPRLSIVKSA